MSVLVINCKKCQRVFQRMASDYCPDCVKHEDEQLTKVYRTLQKSAPQGGMDIHTLGQELGLNTDDIEKLYFEGRLGTASIYLKIPCQSCKRLTRENERKGRYCVPCSEKTSTEAGVSVKSLQTIRDDEEERKRRELKNAMSGSTIHSRPTHSSPVTSLQISVTEHSAVPVNGAPPPTRQFGFSRNKDGH